MRRCGVGCTEISDRMSLPGANADGSGCGAIGRPCAGCARFKGGSARAARLYGRSPGPGRTPGSDSEGVTRGSSVNPAAACPNDVGAEESGPVGADARPATHGAAALVAVAALLGLNSAADADTEDLSRSGTKGLAEGRKGFSSIANPSLG